MIELHLVKKSDPLGTALERTRAGWTGYSVIREQLTDLSFADTRRFSMEKTGIYSRNDHQPLSSIENSSHLGDSHEC